MSAPPGPRLPDFIIIGAMKSGTTTLDRLLRAHPGVEMARRKETDIFLAPADPARIARRFAAQYGRRPALRGEASPNYTKRRDFPGVPERIAATCPGARLIYIVRDPVARAEAQFRHAVRHGALSPEPGRLSRHAYAHLLDASLYARQIEAYLAHFPATALLVIDLEDLRAAPQRVMDRLAAHLGLAPHPAPSGAWNGAGELSRLPAPLLRLGRSPAGRRLSAWLSPERRDRLRGLLARGPARPQPALPPDLVARLRRDLAADAARFRALTGRRFAGWSV